MKEKPVYKCKAHGFFVFPSGEMGLDMTILEDHEASGQPAGSSGHTSALNSIDFINGIVVTRNSIYVYDPSDLGH